MTTVKLLPGETMAQYRQRRAFDVQCATVVSVVRRNPGIASKDDIATMTGLDADLVAKCLRAINHNDTRFVRVEWGGARARGGPWAGRFRLGWFVQDVAAYQHVMDYADYHSSRVEAGVRQSRIHRHLYAQGLSTPQAAAVVREIEDRMKVPVDQLTAREAKTFERLATKQAIQVIKNGA